MNLGEIGQYLDLHEPQMTAFLQKLVQIPTVNPPGDGFLDCADFLATKLQSIGCEVDIHRVPDSRTREVFPDYVNCPRANVLARLDVGAPRTLHFNAHFDVVPAGSGWSLPPFAGTIREGRIYGRGTADMKGSIAAFSYALEAFSMLGQEPAMNVEVSFVCDEEMGGELGAEEVVENHMAHSRADVCLVGEGASGNAVGIGHNGVIWQKVHLHGRAAHASRPEAGVNVVEHFARLVDRLRPLRQEIRSRRFSYDDESSLQASLTLGGTMGMGEGAKTNVVPAELWFTLDRRVLPNEDMAEAEKELRTILLEHGRSLEGREARVESILTVPPYFFPASHSLPQTFARVLRQVRGEEPYFHVTGGFTDARAFALGRGLPTIGYGTAGQNFHAADEFIQLKDLLGTARVYAAFLKHGWS